MNKSRLIDAKFIDIGKIIALTPNTKPTLAILDPTTLPIANEGLFSKTAIRLTNNSGKDVPNATTVKPITSFEIPNLFEILTPPLIIHSAPNYSNKEPTINDKILISISNYIICYRLYIPKPAELPYIELFFLLSIAHEFDLKKSQF